MDSLSRAEEITSEVRRLVLTCRAMEAQLQQSIPKKTHEEVVSKMQATIDELDGELGRIREELQNTKGVTETINALGAQIAVQKEVLDVQGQALQNQTEIIEAQNKTIESLTQKLSHETVPAAMYHEALSKVSAAEERLSQTVARSDYESLQSKLTELTQTLNGMVPISEIEALNAKVSKEFVSIAAFEEVQSRLSNSVPKEELVAAETKLQEIEAKFLNYVPCEELVNAESRICELESKLSESVPKSEYDELNAKFVQLSATPASAAPSVETIVETTAPTTEASSQSPEPVTQVEASMVESAKAAIETGVETQALASQVETPAVEIANDVETAVVSSEVPAAATGSPDLGTIASPVEAALTPTEQAPPAEGVPPQVEMAVQAPELDVAPETSAPAAVETSPVEGVQMTLEEVQAVPEASSPTPVPEAASESTSEISQIQQTAITTESSATEEVVAVETMEQAIVPAETASSVGPESLVTPSVQEAQNEIQNCEAPSLAEAVQTVSLDASTVVAQVTESLASIQQPECAPATEETVADGANVLATDQVADRSTGSQASESEFVTATADVQASSQEIVGVSPVLDEAACISEVDVPAAQAEPVTGEVPQESVPATETPTTVETYSQPEMIASSAPDQAEEAAKIPEQLISEPICIAEVSAVEAPSSSSNAEVSPIIGMAQASQGEVAEIPQADAASSEVSESAEIAVDQAQVETLAAPITESSSPVEEMKSTGELTSVRAEGTIETDHPAEIREVQTLTPPLSSEVLKATSAPTTINLSTAETLTPEATEISLPAPTGTPQEAGTSVIVEQVSQSVVQVVEVAPQAVEAVPKIEENPKPEIREVQSQLSELETVSETAQPAYSAPKVVDYYLGFIFRNTGFCARSGLEFTQALERIPVDVLQNHMNNGDFEKWFEDVLSDKSSADAIKSIRESGIKGEELRLKILAVIAPKYKR